MINAAFAVFGPVRVTAPGDLVYVVGHRGTVALPQQPMDEAACRAVLGKLYTEGNGMGDGEGFTVNGRSMSARDVVTIEGCGTWRCDSAGWTELAGMEAARFPVAGADLCLPTDYAVGSAAARAQTVARGFRSA